tara:strand:- start:98 stop:481 length:384 start_codon:yes stop_codon:yes gene_type:complete
MCAILYGLGCDSRFTRLAQMEEYSDAPRHDLVQTLDKEGLARLEVCERKGGRWCCMHNVRALHQAELALIAQYGGFCVYLNGLTQLDAVTAEKPAAFKGKCLVINRLPGEDTMHCDQLWRDTNGSPP